MHSVFGFISLSVHYTVLLACTVLNCIVLCCTVFSSVVLCGVVLFCISYLTKSSVSITSLRYIFEVLVSVLAETETVAEILFRL